MKKSKAITYIIKKLHKNIEGAWFLIYKEINEDNIKVTHIWVTAEMDFELLMNKIDEVLYNSNNKILDLTHKHKICVLPSDKLTTEKL